MHVSLVADAPPQFVFQVASCAAVQRTTLDCEKATLAAANLAFSTAVWAAIIESVRVMSHTALRGGHHELPSKATQVQVQSDIDWMLVSP